MQSFMETSPVLLVFVGGRKYTTPSVRSLKSHQAKLCSHWGFSLCGLCVLCSSVVNVSQERFTTKTQRTQRRHGELQKQPFRRSSAIVDHSDFLDCYQAILDQFVEQRQKLLNLFQAVHNLDDHRHIL